VESPFATFMRTCEH